MQQAKVAEKKKLMKILDKLFCINHFVFGKQREDVFFLKHNILKWQQFKKNKTPGGPMQVWVKVRITYTSLSLMKNWLYYVILTDECESVKSTVTYVLLDSMTH